jgi:hypothetical protein
VLQYAAVTFDYGSFFSLAEGFTPNAVRVRSAAVIPDPYALTRAEAFPQRAVRFVHDEGRDLHDLVGTTYAVIDLLSDRAIRMLTEGQFTGWTTYPIEIRDAHGGLVAGYRGLAVTGRCGPIQDSLSRIEVLPPPISTGKAMPHRIGLLFDPGTWDQSDVFTPEGTGFVFVTEAVRDAIAEAKLTNLDLRALTEVHRLVLGDP